MRARVSQKSLRFTESVIREMTRLAHRHGAVNLSQGFPDFPAPEAIKEEAARAVHADVNQYAITWGAQRMRDALVAKQQRFTGLAFDPETEVTVCCGSTECMAAVMLALVDPGDEVVVFEPYYENYGPDAILSGAVPRFVRLREPDWSFDPAELAAAFNARTRAIVVNTPNNPTGKVFTRDELTQIAALCQKWDAIAITDEIYEHILYDGAKHVSMAAVDGMRERTVRVYGLS
jgi:aminotransferase